MVNQWCPVWPILAWSETNRRGRLRPGWMLLIVWHTWVAAMVAQEVQRAGCSGSA